jgi:hypothetical protein
MRRAPTGKPATEQGFVYTLGLHPWLPEIPCDNGHQVGHYTGFAPRDRLTARLAVQARGGSGAARLMQVHKSRGGRFCLVALEWGTRDRETTLHERGASRRCTACAVGHGSAAGMGWVYILHRGGQHFAGYTADTEALMAATGRCGRDAARHLPARPRRAAWRLVRAERGTPDRAAQLAALLAVSADDECPVCRAAKEEADRAELLAAIARGEVADRYHPRYGWAARWHTLNGEPLRAPGRPGGALGRSVSAAAAVLVRRGLAVRTVSLTPARVSGGTWRPYRLTPGGVAALGPRADGLPVNRDGSLSRSRTTDEQKQRAGVMTSVQQAEHTALCRPDHPRRAERLRGPLAADRWAIPAAALSAGPDGTGAGRQRPAAAIASATSGGPAAAARDLAVLEAGPADRAAVEQMECPVLA